MNRILFPPQLLDLQLPGSGVDTSGYPSLHGRNEFALPITSGMLHDLHVLSGVLLASSNVTVEVRRAIIEFYHQTSRVYARGEPAPAAAPNNAPDARDPELWGILFELRDGVQKLEVGLNAIIDRLDNVDDQIRRIETRSVNAAMSILRRPINRLPPPAGAVAALPIDFVQCPTRKVKDLVGLSYEALHATGAAYGLVFQENARREDMAEAIWRYLGGQRLGVY